MFRKLFITLSLVITAGLVHGQTSISASDVSDSFDHPIASAKLCFQPVDATNTPTGFRVGSTQVVSTPVCGLVSNGVLQSGLTVVPTPSGVYYHITAQNRTSNAVIRDYGMTQITGGSWTLDTYDPSTAVLPVTALEMGTVETLSPGSDAFCSLSGTSPILLNCGIPQGTAGSSLNPRGSWAATTPYAKNDLYVESGNAYIVVIAYTSGASFGSTDTTNSVEINTTNGQPITPSTVAPKLSPEIDVTNPTYGAVGDCLPGSGSTSSCTDNCTPLTNAFAAAHAAGVSVYFPINPFFPQQTVYYTSCSINPQGVSFHGPLGSAGQSQGYVGAMLVSVRGAPGKDVFDVPDPGASAPSLLNMGFSVRDIGINVDSTVDASSSGSNSFPNRLPGRTCFDVVANGTAVITSAVQCQFQPGDVGQAILVHGVTTTIASYQSVNQVTLAATVTSGTGLTAYVSVMNLSATQTIGNCGFAMDASGLAGGYGHGPIRADFTNVVIQINDVRTTNTCGYFFQGNVGPYQTKFDHDFVGNDFGFVFAMPNTAAGQAGGYTCQGLCDFNTFDDTWITATYPWVSYGGNDDKIVGMQLSGALFGPQILTGNGESGVAETVAPSSWSIDIPEVEGACENITPVATSFRITGHLHQVNRLSLQYCSYGNTFQWDASMSTVADLLLAQGTAAITGNQNTFTNPFYPVGPPATYNVTGVGNQLISCNAGDIGYGQTPGRCQYAGIGAVTNSTVQLSRGGFALGRTGDFIGKGAVNYYFNDDDLWVWPTELMNPYALVTPVQDSSSVTGTAIQMTGSSSPTFYGSDSASWVFGEQLPAGKMRLYIMAKANTSLSWYAVLASYSSGTGYNALCTVSATLTTSYAVYECDGDATAYPGTTGYISLGPAGTGNTVSIAWIAFRPWSADGLVTGTQTAGGFKDTGLTSQNVVGTDSAGNLVAGILPSSGFALLTASLDPTLFSVNQYFGVATMGVATTAQQLTVVGEGTESCTSPPSIAVFDCGAAGTSCSSPNSLGNVTMSGTSGTSVSTTLGGTIVSGHEIRFFVGSGTCATPPTIYATLTGHS
jgi:hypothetical protein